MRRSLKLSAAAVALALALTGCSGALDKIDYKSQGADKAPEVTFETPFKVDDTQTKVLEEGDGDQVAEGDTVLVDATLYNGADGKNVQDTRDSQPLTVTVDDELKDKLPELYDTLKDAKVGTTFAYAQKPDEAKTGSKDASVLEVYTVRDKILKEAQGKEVTPQAGLPTVTMKDDGPQITIPKDQDEPTELTAQKLIEGEGTEVKGSDTVFVKYSGVKWSDGKQFDSNWTKDEPTSFALSSVIKGWTEGLKGKKVGDRVLLVVPADQAYGTAEELGKDTSKPAGALVFVVDVLGTEPTATQATASPTAGASSSATPAPAESSAQPSDAASTANQ